jgi:hypothetical protein
MNGLPLGTLWQPAFSFDVSVKESFCSPPEYSHDNVADPIHDDLNQNVQQHRVMMAVWSGNSRQDVSTGLNDTRVIGTRL